MGLLQLLGPPDPEKLEAHLDGVRRGLARCRETRDAVENPRRKEVLDRRVREYEDEVERLEGLVEKLRSGDLDGTPWEPRKPMDDLTRRALIQHVRDQADTDDDGEAQVTMTPGLPLLVPNVPTGLSQDESARREAEAWRRIYRRWAEVVADGWRIHDPALRPLLDQVARGWKKDRGEAKRLLAHTGLVEAMAAADEATRIRVGSGEGSGYVRDEDGEVAEVVPEEQGIVGGLVWLDQEAKARAKALLRTYAEDPPDHEVGWPTDPETGERLEVPDDCPPPDAALVAEGRDDRTVLLSEALMAAAPQQRRILLAWADPDLGDLVDELSDSPLTLEDRELLGQDCESWAAVARELDVTPSAVSTQVDRLREKLD